MTPTELTAANAAYKKLTDLQDYRATLGDTPPTSVSFNVLTTSPDLKGLIADDVISVVEDAIADAQTAFDNL